MEENIIMVPGSGTKVIVRDVKQEPLLGIFLSFHGLHKITFLFSTSV